MAMSTESTSGGSTGRVRQAYAREAHKEAVEFANEIIHHGAGATGATTGATAATTAFSSETGAASRSPAVVDWRLPTDVTSRLRAGDNDGDDDTGSDLALDPAHAADVPPPRPSWARRPVVSNAFRFTSDDDSEAPPRDGTDAAVAADPEAAAAARAELEADALVALIRDAEARRSYSSDADAAAHFRFRAEKDWTVIAAAAQDAEVPNAGCVW
ncbi:hypothetical protein HK405_006307, partial [Cladochytrium tenue]